MFDIVMGLFSVLVSEWEFPLIYTYTLSMKLKRFEIILLKFGYLIYHIPLIKCRRTNLRRQVTLQCKDKNENLLLSADGAMYGGSYRLSIRYTLMKYS